MVKTTSSSTKRFGARYGRSLKERLSKIEKLQKKKYKCPYCAKEKVRREAAGIWHCTKCNAKFASRAFTVAAKPEVIKHETTEELPVMEEEPQEAGEVQEAEEA